MKNSSTRALCEGAAMVALGMVLGYIKLFELPQGGSISIGMLPILLFAVRFGLSKGLICSLAYGLLQLIFDGAYALGWTSMLLDYIAAYGILGAAGIFSGKKGGIYWGTVLGSVLRFIVHYISGVTIYRINAPTEIFNHMFTNPELYSLVYNGSYMLIDMVICMVIFTAIYRPMKPYFTGEDLRRK